jgi:hypothetical protein
MMMAFAEKAHFKIDSVISFAWPREADDEFEWYEKVATRA